MTKIMKITRIFAMVCITIVFLGAASGSAEEAQHPENAIVPEESFVEEGGSPQEGAECNIFGALEKETAVPLNLYKIAGELLKEAKGVIGNGLKGVLKCSKIGWAWQRRKCKSLESTLLEGIKNLKSKHLINQLVVALKPHAVAFFKAEEGKKVAVLATTFNEAKPMGKEEAETFVASQLSTELGQLLSLLQKPMMKLIPTILFAFIPGWSLVPKKELIIETATTAAIQAGDDHGRLTDKFQELMHQAATHIIKVTAIGELVSKVITDTPAICAFGLAQKFAMTATASQC